MTLATATVEMINKKLADATDPDLLSLFAKAVRDAEGEKMFSPAQRDADEVVELVREEVLRRLRAAHDA